MLLQLLLAAGACAPHPTQGSAQGPIEIRTVLGLDRAPHAGERFPLRIEIEMDREWAETRLVQLFPAPLDLPLQVDTGWSDLETVRIEFLAEADGGLGLVLDEAVFSAGRGSAENGRTRAVLEARAVADRAGPLGLPAPVVQYRATTAFREDFIRGRVPVNPVAGTAVGTPLQVQVAPLPETGRPPGFTGAVGTFELEARVDDPAQAMAGAPFAMTVSVLGDGHLPGSAVPALPSLPAGLALLGAPARLAAAAGVDRVSFRYDLVAQAPGEIALPTAELVHFDPVAGGYGTATSAPLTAFVRRGSEALERPTEAKASDQQAPETAGLFWTIGVGVAVSLLALVSALRRIRARREFRDSYGFGIRRVGFVSKYEPGAAAGNSVAMAALAKAFGRREVEAISVHGPEDAARCDVLHAFHGGETARRARDLARAAGIPFVVTLTGTDLNSNEEAADRGALGDAAALIALTEEQAAGLDSIGFGDRVQLIPQAIDFQPAEVIPEDPRGRFGLEPGTRVALMLGGLRPVKGQDMALDAMARLAEGTASEEARSWRLVILGAPLDDAYAGKLRTSLPPGARLHPPVPRPDILALLRGADALVNASQSEGESRAILEAQALGTPVIARRNGGNAALLGEGAAGVLFDDAAGLADALERLALDEELRPSIVQAAQGAVLSRPSLQEEALETLRIYARARRDFPDVETRHGVRT